MTNTPESELKELIQEYENEINVEKLAGNVVKEYQARGIVMGLRMAEGVMRTRPSDESNKENKYLCSACNKEVSPFDDDHYLYCKAKPVDESKCEKCNAVLPKFSKPSICDDCLILIKPSSTTSEVEGWAIIKDESGFICGGGMNQWPVYQTQEGADRANSYKTQGYKGYSVKKVYISLHPVKEVDGKWPEKREPCFKPGAGIQVPAYDVASVYNSGWNHCLYEFMKVINSRTFAPRVEVSENQIAESILKEWTRYERLNVQMTSREEAFKLAKAIKQELEK